MTGRPMCVDAAVETQFTPGRQANFQSLGWEEPWPTGPSSEHNHSPIKPNEKSPLAWIGPRQPILSAALCFRLQLRTAACGGSSEQA